VKVLVVGATGFIGRHLVRALAAAGHQVTGASRSRDALPDDCARHLPLDYTALPGGEELKRLVAGHEVVINAVGILRERGRQTFAALHDEGPRALFTACTQAGVPRIIQISALGADADAIARYHRSKHAADRFLMEQPGDQVILQPSLVYGPGGSSARLFEMMAALPVIPLPSGGRQRVQPVHVDDLVAGVVKLVEAPSPLRLVLAVTGPEPLSMREFLVQLRAAAFGRASAPTIGVPRLLMKWGAHLGQYLPGALLDPETLAMLERGNVANAAPFARWLGRMPRPVSEFVPQGERESRWTAASLAWLLPLLRMTVAFLWLIAAIVSMGPYPVDASLRLLRDIGIGSALAPVLLVGAIGVDLAFGILTLLPRRPRGLWWAQIAVVLGYTAIISWRLPELWLEPFGPVAKNVPILALLLLLNQLERRR
jgi:uncharacterized protein YbjT (DUF2867 family)